MFSFSLSPRQCATTSVMVLSRQTLTLTLPSTTHGFISSPGYGEMPPFVNKLVPHRVSSARMPCTRTVTQGRLDCGVCSRVCRAAPDLGAPHLPPAAGSCCALPIMHTSSSRGEFERLYLYPRQGTLFDSSLINMLLPPGYNVRLPI